MLVSCFVVQCFVTFLDWRERERERERKRERELIALLTFFYLPSVLCHKCVLWFLSTTSLVGLHCVIRYFLITLTTIFNVLIRGNSIARGFPFMNCC